MSLKISKIKKLPSGKYNLILDNKEKIVTYDDVIIENNLLYGKDIDSNLLNKMNADTQYYEIINKIIKLIGIRLRSEKEIKNYLDKNKVDKKQQEEIIKKLLSNGLINDLAFTKAFVADKINLSNVGPIKIKRELLEHNILENIIDEQINKVDRNIYIDKIKKYIQKKEKTNRKYSNFIFKQKLMSDLINLGFYRDDINMCLEGLCVNNDSMIDIAYDKIYKKLSIKYDGNELYRKIREKLYQKGFSLSEIENIINKKIG